MKIQNISTFPETIEIPPNESLVLLDNVDININRIIVLAE
jgi:hypothetical protein